MTEDNKTIIAARSLVKTSRELAANCKTSGDAKEYKRLLDQADWYEEYADRLEARIKEMDNDE